MNNIRVAYCTGFWSTNTGNGFFSLGVEYALKKILGEDNVTVISDIQTYTTAYGKRIYPNKNQLDYISNIDVDYVILAGPVLSKYFVMLWGDILKKLEKRGIRYIILSAGMMKMTPEAYKECEGFFIKYPPYMLVSRERATYEAFGRYADNSYDGICFAFFAPDYYKPVPINEKYMVANFDKINEPKIWRDDLKGTDNNSFEFKGGVYHVEHEGILSKISYKTDRFSDALIYAASFLPQKKRSNIIGEYKVYRTDHRFHPHFVNKIYSQENSFCADLPYGYLNIYANSELTLSDRIHACAVTLAYGHSAKLFTETNRVGLLERVGAGDIMNNPVKLDIERLNNEKERMLSWIKRTIYNK